MFPWVWVLRAGQEAQMAIHRLCAPVHPPREHHALSHLRQRDQQHLPAGRAPWFIDSLIYSFMHAYISVREINNISLQVRDHNSFIHSFIHSFMHAYISVSEINSISLRVRDLNSSIHSFIHSFIHPFMHTYISVREINNISLQLRDLNTFIHSLFYVRDLNH